MKSLTVGETNYKSQRAFAIAQCVSDSMVSHAIKYELDLEQIGRRNKRRTFYRGKWYETQSEAARANGVTRQAVNKEIRQEEKRNAKS